MKILIIFHYLILHQTYDLKPYLSIIIHLIDLNFFFLLFNSMFEFNFLINIPIINILH